MLDAQITPLEVREQVRRLKNDKACVPDGIAPGLLKLLPPEWIMTLTVILNNIYVCYIRRCLGGSKDGCSL